MTTQVDLNAIVSIETLQVPLYIDLFAVALGSVQGALFAAGFQRIDLLGVSIIGIATGMGGSVFRDVMLGISPAILQVNWYLLAGVGGAIIGMLLYHLFMRVDWMITFFDALTIGTYGALGTTKALSYGLPVIPALFVGTLAAVGGGVLRDLLLNIPISVLQVGSLYAVAAFVGNVTVVVSIISGTSVTVAGIVCVAVTTVIRLFAVQFGWSLPEQRAIKQRRITEVEETIEALRTGVIEIDGISFEPDGTAHVKTQILPVISPVPESPKRRRWRIGSKRG